MSLMLSDLQRGIQLVRYLGPEWAWSRAINAVGGRIGWLEKRCPQTQWRCRSAAESQEQIERWRTLRGRFFFEPSDRQRYRDILRQFDDPGTTDPIHEADAADRGVLRYFGHHDLSVGAPPDWFRNPWTGQRMAPNGHWSKVSDFSQGDIKAIWEPSRFSFAFALVRAWWRTADDRYPEAFWRYVESWREANPPNTGPNWRCGQEATFRSMAWIFGLWGFGDAAASTSDRVSALLEMLETTGRRIEVHIGYALSQHNNHGISEAVGLFTLGTLFPWWSKANAWERRGRTLLERLAGELVYEDGGFSQHSFNYQRVMLHDYAWALRIAELSGRPLNQVTRDQIARSARLLANWSHAEDGSPPRHGPDDGARILPLDNTAYADYRSAAQVASVAAGGPRFFANDSGDESVLWLCGPGGLEVPKVSLCEGGLHAPCAGYHGWRNGQSSVFLHVPRFRHRPGHADLLHVDLVWNGVRLTKDPGSFSYNSPPPWDHGFAQTRFHNTVEVDHRDPMDRVSRFIWLPWPDCRVTGGFDAPDGSLNWMDAEQDGYRRLADPVQHCRRVVQSGKLGMVVMDRLSGRLPHHYRLHWLFAKTSYRIDLETGCLELQVRDEWLTIQVGAREAKPQFSVVVGAEGKARGWESPHYLERIPAISLDCTLTASAAVLWTAITPPSVRVVVMESGLRLVHYGDVLDVPWPATAAVQNSQPRLLRQQTVPNVFA